MPEIIKQRIKSNAKGPHEIGGIGFLCESSPRQTIILILLENFCRRETLTNFRNPLVALFPFLNAN